MACKHNDRFPQGEAEVPCRLWTRRSQPKPKQSQSALLVMNKIDLAPALGADREVLHRDAQQTCAYRPFVCTHHTRGTGGTDVIAWLTQDVFFLAWCALRGGCVRPPVGAAHGPPMGMLPCACPGTAR